MAKSRDLKKRMRKPSKTEERGKYKQGGKNNLEEMETLKKTLR